MREVGRRTRVDVAWALVLGLSIAVALLALRPVDPPAEPLASAPLRELFASDVGVDDIAALEIGDRSRGLVLERGVGWDPATREAIQLLRNARLERVVDPSGAARARYGLETPVLEVRVFVGASRRGRDVVLELLIGDRAPDSLSYYVETRPGPGIAKLPVYQVDNLKAMFETL